VTNSRPWTVGLVGLVIAISYAVLVLASADFNPTIFLAEGRENSVPLSYAEEQLDMEIRTRPALGHDGKFFFAQSVDPWISDPATLARVLDFPTYRAQRMLYPTLASVLGTLSPDQVVWGLLLANLVGAGIGSAATAAVASGLGGSPWLGLAFAINPGIWSEIDIDGSGVLALALALLGLWAVLRQHEVWATLAFAGAALSRETMLLFAGGIFIGWWLTKRTWKWHLVVAPIAAVAIWRAFLTLRFDGYEDPAKLGEGLTRNFNLIPLGGLIEAISGWQDPQEAVWGWAIVALLAMFALRVLRDPTAIGLAAVPFLLLAIFGSETIWREPYDIARATSPIFTMYPVLLFSHRV
jgi:hypothetical protein